jgi:hypothetical protein
MCEVVAVVRCRGGKGEENKLGTVDGRCRNIERLSPETGRDGHLSTHVGAARSRPVKIARCKHAQDKCRLLTADILIMPLICNSVISWPSLSKSQPKSYAPRSLNGRMRQRKQANCRPSLNIKMICYT